jgi:peptidoglycan/LPS O-acetylase OafA/YrhL
VAPPFPPYESRPSWSSRRRKLLVGLGVGLVAGVVASFLLPARYGIPALFLAGLCGFLLVVAVVVFVTYPGPGTLGQVLRTPPLAGAVLVVAVLLVLANPAGSLRWLWVVAAVVAAGWTAFAVWDTRRSGG